MHTSGQESDVLNPQRRSTPENLAAIRDSLGEMAQHEKERVHGALERGKDRARVMERRFEGYVREHPIQTVVYAVSAGALLGWLLGRRR